MKLTALRNLTYANKQVKAGDAFEAESRFAKVLKAAGRAVDYVEPAPAVVVQAEAAPAPAADPPSDATSTPASPEAEGSATEEPPMAEADATPVEPMTTKDNGALVPPRRGVYRRRDIVPGETTVMDAAPPAAADPAEPV